MYLGKIEAVRRYIDDLFEVDAAFDAEHQFLVDNAEEFDKRVKFDISQQAFQRGREVYGIAVGTLSRRGIDAYLGAQRKINIRGHTVFGHIVIGGILRRNHESVQFLLVQSDFEIINSETEVEYFHSRFQTESDVAVRISEFQRGILYGYGQIAGQEQSQKRGYRVFGQSYREALGRNYRPQSDRFGICGIGITRRIVYV